MSGFSKTRFLSAGAVRDVRDLDAAALKAMEPVIAQAQAELSAQLQHWLRLLGPDAALKKYGAAQVRQAQLLLGIAHEQIKHPRRSFQTIVARGIKGVLGDSGATRAALSTLGHQLNQLRAAFHDLPKPDLARAAWFAKGDQLLLDRHASSAARYAGQVKDDLKFQMGVGLAKGETLQELVTRVANVSSFKQAVNAANAGQAGRAMAAGLTQRYRYWSDRLVRTEMVHSYNYAAAAGIAEVHKVDDRIVMMWDASLDLRVCRLCRGLHGKIAEVDGEFEGGYVRPPAHPYCRCALVAWMPGEWDDHPALGGE